MKQLFPKWKQFNKRAQGQFAASLPMAGGTCTRNGGFLWMTTAVEGKHE